MSNWQVYDINAVDPGADKGQHADGVSYRECLRVPSMHCGVYSLPAGSTDMQTPHDEDEMYFVLEGKGHLRIGEETRPVHPGMLLYVQASQDHSFFEIEEDMKLLVMFATGRNP